MAATTFAPAARLGAPRAAPAAPVKKIGRPAALVVSRRGAALAAPLSRRPVRAAAGETETAAGELGGVGYRERRRVPVERAARGCPVARASVAREAGRPCVGGAPCPVPFTIARTGTLSLGPGMGAGMRRAPTQMAGRFTPPALSPSSEGQAVFFFWSRGPARCASAPLSRPGAFAPQQQRWPAPAPGVGAGGGEGRGRIARKETGGRGASLSLSRPPGA
jgi:hypothetical protein